MFLTLLQITTLPPTVTLHGTMTAGASLSGAVTTSGGLTIGMIGTVFAGATASAGPRVRVGGTIAATSIASAAPPPPPDCLAVGPCAVLVQATFVTDAQRPYVLQAAATLSATPTVQTGAVVALAADWAAYAPVVATGGGGGPPPSFVALAGSVLGAGAWALDGTDVTPSKFIAGDCTLSPAFTLAGARVVMGASATVRGVMLARPRPDRAGGLLRALPTRAARLHRPP